MNNPTRQRMLLGTISLIRQRGINATSAREVVRYTGTPRGSLAHYFPAGRIQLLTEALTMARTHISQRLRMALDNAGAQGGLMQFSREWQQQLVASDFHEGCPMMAAATERLVDETSDANRLRQQAQIAFDDWEQLLADQLRKEGACGHRATALSRLTIASWEGALALCQTQRTIQPLIDVTHTLCDLFADATGTT